MSKDTIHSSGERKYDLQEAARILNKSEAALRMQIRRKSIRADEQPLGNTGRFKYVIPESEVEKERKRLEAATHRSDTRQATTAVGSRAAPEIGQDIAATLRAMNQRQEQLERELKQEREDTRSLIRSIEQQVELLKMMVTTLVDQKKA